ncbi:alpha-(1,3)-fucosyltransferase 7 [Clarias gariepinus]|nr:alpha-(1,3)-fucosyltransferase 7 isoform X2 [Clarias gariepinus]
MKLNLRLNKKLLFFVLSCILLSLQWTWHLQHLEGVKKPNITILLWYWPFHVPYSLKEDICQKNFSISGCHLVDNRTLYSIADIVVFHQKELKTGSQTLPLQLSRPDHQRWLWLSLESPQNNGNLSKYAGIFNLTMSYHPGADVTVPYGRIEKKSSKTETDDFVMPMNKTHLVCWVVSNYQNQHKRTSVYQQLKKFIPVQMYGRAVRKPVIQSMLLPTISRCYFYLSFENSVSPHYITEKLWRNAFMAGTVPVVLGPPRSHYEAVAPPHSFIHVDDFDSIAELAKFLTELAGDAKRYDSYFSWHQNYTVKLFEDWRERLCNICQVYDEFPNYKIYHKLDA